MFRIFNVNVFLSSFFKYIGGLDSSDGLMVDLGDQGAGQGPAEDVDEPPPEQPVEQRSLVVPSVATACQDSSRLVRPFWAREAVGLVRLGLNGQFPASHTVP